MTRYAMVLEKPGVMRLIDAARLYQQRNDLLAALIFALENLELANPIVELAGHVTSLPSAMRKAVDAIAKVEVEPL